MDVASLEINSENSIKCCLYLQHSCLPQHFLSVLEFFKTNQNRPKKGWFDYMYLIPLDLGGFIQLFLFCTFLLSTLIDLILVVCDLFFFCDVIKGAHCLRCPALVLLLSANTVLQLSGSQGCIINKNALQCSAFYFNCTFSSGTQWVGDNQSNGDHDDDQRWLKWIGDLHPETSGPVITLDTELTWVLTKVWILCFDNYQDAIWIWKSLLQFLDNDTWFIVELTFTSRRIARVLFTTVKTLVFEDVLL